MQTHECINLKTENETDRIALRGVRLRATLAGMSQSTTVEQTFINLEDKAIEAIYTFPLADGSAVSGFEVVTGDHVLTGKVDETDKAIATYDDAISDGHGAFLLEQARPDIFTIRVGNLKPKQMATIRISYVRPLDVNGREIRVAFPTTVAPRYVTATGTDPIQAIIDGDAVNPPHVLHVPYGLTMEVDLALSQQIDAITSPSHAISAKPKEDGQWRVNLAGENAPMDRDIVLSLTMHEEQAPTAQMATDDKGNSYVAVTFVPEFDESDLSMPAAGETVFVIDCSGSMQGESIAQAKGALSLCLRSLSPGDTFNICRFGSAFEMMFPQPMVYSQDTLNVALEYVAKMSANLGGTELHAPLVAVMTARPRTGIVRQVIVLTDGQVSNEPAVLDLARSLRIHNRIFSFGIGAASSSHLVNGLARATGGAAEFISAGERIEEKVLRTFSRIGSPPVTDVQIDWGGADVVQAPDLLPPLFDGDAMILFARALGKLPAKVTLKCKTPAGDKSWPVKLQTTSADAVLLGRLWARRMIQQIEEDKGVRETVRRENVSSESKQTWDAARLIALSKEFNLLCGLTTFIAVEHRSIEERNEGKPELRKVPVQLANGWHGIDVGTGLAGFVGAMAAPAQAGGFKSVNRAHFAAASGGATRASGIVASVSKMFGGAPASPVPAPPQFSVSPPSPTAGGNSSSGTHLYDKAEANFAKAAPDPVSQLLSLQTAEGSFGWDSASDALLKLLGSDVPSLEAKLTDALPATAKVALSGRTTATAMTLVLLNGHFAPKEPIWRRAEMKAVRYLASELKMSAVHVKIWIATVAGRLKPVV